MITTLQKQEWAFQGADNRFYLVSGSSYMSVHTFAKIYEVVHVKFI